MASNYSFLCKSHREISFRENRIVYETAHTACFDCSSKKRDLIPFFRNETPFLENSASLPIILSNDFAVITVCYILQVRKGIFVGIHSPKSSLTCSFRINAAADGIQLVSRLQKRPRPLFEMHKGYPWSACSPVSFR